MPREYGRNRRVADQVQREVAAMVQAQLSPGVHGLITVSGAVVSPDLRHATVYFTCIGGNSSPAELGRTLNGLAAQFRHQLASTLSMRTVPRIHFEFDESVERGSRINALLGSVRDDEK